VHACVTGCSGPGPTLDTPPDRTPCSQAPALGPLLGALGVPPAWLPTARRRCVPLLACNCKAEGAGGRAGSGRRVGCIRAGWGSARRSRLKESKLLYEQPHCPAPPYPNLIKAPTTHTPVKKQLCTPAHIPTEQPCAGLMLSSPAQGSCAAAPRPRPRTCAARRRGMSPKCSARAQSAYAANERSVWRRSK